MTSTINYNVNIGMLAIAGISSALLADYFVTPVLVLWTKPFGMGNEVLGFKMKAYNENRSPSHDLEEFHGS